MAGIGFRHSDFNSELVDPRGSVHPHGGTRQKHWPGAAASDAGHALAAVSPVLVDHPAPDLQRPAPAGKLPAADGGQALSGDALLYGQHPVHAPRLPAASARDHRAGPFGRDGKTE